jgi:hypothetical protein
VCLPIDKTIITSGTVEKIHQTIVDFLLLCIADGLVDLGLVIS